MKETEEQVRLTRTLNFLCELVRRTERAYVSISVLYFVV